MGLCAATDRAQVLRVGINVRDAREAMSSAAACLSERKVGAMAKGSDHVFFGCLDLGNLFTMLVAFLKRKAK